MENVALDCLLSPGPGVSRPLGAQAQEHRWFSRSLNSPRFPGDTAPNVLTRNQRGFIPGDKVLGDLDNQCDIVGMKVAPKSEREIAEPIESGRQRARAGRWIGIARAQGVFEQGRPSISIHIGRGIATECRGVGSAG